MKTKRVSALLVLASACVSTAALADVAGRYETRDENVPVDMEITVEVDGAGNVRLQMAAMGLYYLIRDGETFVVQRGDSGATVMRLADLLAAQQDAVKRLGWKDPVAPETSPPAVHFASMGSIAVGSREGIGYGIVSDEYPNPRYASIVIGSDPQLAPLGQAIADAQASSVKGMGSMGSMLTMMNDQMRELLQKGAPLRMLDMELTDVSFDPIPRARFELPAEPLTPEQIGRKITVSVEPPPTLPPRP
jgi:hypothetical protein